MRRLDRPPSQGGTSAKSQLLMSRTRRRLRAASALNGSLFKMSRRPCPSQSVQPAWYKRDWEQAGKRGRSGTWPGARAQQPPCPLLALPTHASISQHARKSVLLTSKAEDLEGAREGRQRVGDGMEHALLQRQLGELRAARQRSKHALLNLLHPRRLAAAQLQQRWRHGAQDGMGGRQRRAVSD